MNVKSTARIENLCFELKEQLNNIEMACQCQEGKRKYEMTITSGNDGKHMKGSLHFKNRAIDIRSFDMMNPAKTVEAIKQVLNQKGHKFDVIYEGSHIHIEYDPK